MHESDGHNGKSHLSEEVDVRKTLDARSELIAVVSPEFRILEANLAFSDFFHQTRESVIGTPCYRLFHGTEEPPGSCPHRRSMISGKEETGEFRANEKVPFDFELSVSPVFNPAGKIPGFLHVARDVTFQKRKEKLIEVNLRLGEFALNHPLKEILTLTVDHAEELTNSEIGFFHFIEEDESAISLQIWSTKTTTSHCSAPLGTSHYPIAQAGIWVDCYHMKQPVIHNDLSKIMHRKGMPEGHAEVVRELTVPVIRGDRVVAILGVGNKPVWYTHEDVEIVTQLSSLAYEFALSKRFEEALNKKVEELQWFNALMIDREVRMIELKREVNELLHLAGMPEKYSAQ